MKSRRCSTRAIAIVPLLAAGLAFFTPRLAEACGGVFCDAVDPPMPVDQKGEDILFVLDGEEVEAHIRIEYEGEAENFAWVIPLQAAPTEVSVGSDALFARLSLATAARSRMLWDSTCPEDPDDEADGEPYPLLDVGQGSGGEEPEVIFSDTVGAFQVDVLQGGTAAEVIDWLDANGYAQDPDAEPILGEYLSEDFLFAAVKLNGGADVDEIHPITFRFPGTEPCVPLRLTRIAATEDMGVRVYFLGDERAIPLNYDHVVRNSLRIDYETGPSVPLDDEVTAMAVDEAGGHAFATDYAGPSDEVSQQDIYSQAWQSELFSTAAPTTAVDLLESMGLMDCWSADSCRFTHALVGPLLMEYLPPPEGMDPLFFWAYLDDHTELIDLEAWDPEAFAADFEERIVEPGAHAVELLDSWPYLTRMVTTLSPHEMTLDPTFATNADLPDVLPAYTATLQYTCNETSLVTYPDGHEICLPEGQSLPSWSHLPWAARVERIPTSGPPQVLVDNSVQIGVAVDAHNMSVVCDTSEPGWPEDGSSTGGAEEDSEALDGRGCGCTSQRGGPGPVHGGLALMMLLTLWGWQRRGR